MEEQTPQKKLNKLKKKITTSGCAVGTVFGDIYDEIKKQILLLAYEKNNFIDEDLLLNLSKQDDQIGAIAVSLFDKSTITKYLNELSDQLFSASPHKIASTAVAILKHDPKHIKAKVILNNFLDINDESTTAIALDYLKDSTFSFARKNIN